MRPLTDLTVVSDRTPELVERLVGVWERSVRATHTFLSEAEVAEIKPFVPQALAGVETLVLTEKDDEPLGFKTYRRTELDEEGRPYPLLYMRL